jgi:hypothetical protein
MATLPNPANGILLTHLLVSRDVARARLFYTEVLGGEPVAMTRPAIVALANSWIVITTEAGPTGTSRQSSSPRPPTAAPRSAATCATPTATSPRSASSQPPRRAS